MKRIYLIIFFALLLFTKGFSQTQTVTFSTAGSFSWKAPCGVNSIQVEAIGGGGAGGGATGNTRGGGGGAGGAYVNSMNVPVTPGNTYLIVVAKGGAGSNTSVQASVGGDSWFGNPAIILAKGGEGGFPNSGPGGTGTSAGSFGVGITTVYQGGDGSAGVSSPPTARSGAGGGGAGSSGAGGNATTVSGGTGTSVGGGTGGDTKSSTAAGFNGSLYGGGGGGACKISGSAQTGGSGGSGFVKITYIGVPTYCVPTFVTNVEPITNVSFTGNTFSINNTSPATIDGSPALESFCNMADVVQGSTYTISVQGNTNDNTVSYTDYFRVYIDWNQNGVFGDVGNETYNIGTITGSTGTDGNTATNSSISVPATALSGITQMRVIKNLGAYGTPCAANNYGQAEDYLISVTGNCTQPTGATANGTNSTLTVCEGTNVTLRQTGGILGTGAQWKWYTGGCGSSGTLLNTNTNANGSYTFSATPGTTDYFVRGEGGSCGPNGLCQTVRVIVKNLGTITLSSGANNFSACKGVNNASYAGFTIGGGATSASVIGLPAGMSGLLTGNQYIIQGSPSVTGTFNYTITPAGNAPCTNPGISGTITVSQAPVNFTYSTPNPVTYCTGSNITPNNPVTTGGIPDAYSVNPALPTGLSLDPVTGTITGQPLSASALADYLVTASNGCGSKSFTLKLSVSNGDMVFNVTPGGIQNICSTSGGIAIGLGGSEAGVSYQLYNNGSPVGSPLPGTGSVLNFGTQAAQGTYSITTTSGCATNMNGNTILNITQFPTTTFSYASPNCQSGSISPVFGGSPQSGVFTATPSGLAFTNNSTGVIDLSASQAKTYSITYTIAAAGGCPSYIYTQNNFIIGLTPSSYNVFGGGGYCSGSPGVEVGVDNSQVGVNYQLYNGGVPIGVTMPGINGLLTFGTQTAGTYTIVGTSASSPNCQTNMNGNAVVTLNTNPNPIIVTPATSTLCQGNIVSLEASLNPAATSTLSKSVTVNVSLPIPDNSTTGLSSLIKVSGIPNGATITNVAVRFNIPHTQDGDLLINLKGPNGNVLNLVNSIGGSGHNFTATVISALASAGITTASAPFTGTYSPQGTIGVIGANVVTSNISNTSTFAGLYGGTAISANGNWTLSIRDNVGQNVGTLTNWSIAITYSYTSNTTNVTWLPVTDLYTDPGAITPYVAGTATSIVYSKPVNAGTQTYTATATNVYGCNATVQSVLTINPSPTISVSADYCSFPGAVRITATSNIPVTSWIWSNGLAGTNTSTTSYITVNTAGTYYVSASSSANSCPGTGVMSIAQELVVNGDFEAGNTGFVSGYPYMSNTIANSLLNQGSYSVHNDPHFLHNNFWGTDHTTANGQGNYMLINGTGGTSIWKETVTVLPNTSYYFSAYAVSLNNVFPFADLQFIVNGVPVPGSLSTGALPSKSPDNNPGTWIRFYGIWPSGTATTADIEIIDLQTAASGNDFGLDDISFATLSAFLNLTSAPGTDNQTFCGTSAITDISYEVGGDGSQPIVNGLPAGLTQYWNGRDLIISGTPTQYGIFPYTVAGTGCNTKVALGTITVSAPSFAGTFSPTLVNVCYGNSATISINGTVGSVLKWEKSTDSLTWAGAGNAGNTSFTSPVLVNGIYYRVIARNGASSCKADTSLIVKLGISNLWTGKVNTDWNNPGNWSDYQLPSTACTEVYIPNTANQPILSGSPVATIVNLHILLNATLTINNTGLLQIQGDIFNSGIFDVTDGTIEFDGSAPQNITKNVFATNKIKNLIISNDVTLAVNAQDSLTGHLSFGSTNKTFATNGKLTLKSTITGTASVGPIINGNSVNGDVSVERYIATGTGSAPNHGKSWQLLAIPTTGPSLYNGQTINAAWQEGATISNVAPPVPTPGSAGNLVAGYGTMLTTDLGGSAVGARGLGFDEYTTPGPSIKVYNYNNGAAKYDGPTSTGIPIYNPKGYFVFVRGDRSVYAFNQNANPTILRTKGRLFDENYVPPTLNLITNAFESVGNPYASPIDFRLVSKPGLAGVFQVWDPRLGGGYNYGAVQTFTSDIAGNYTVTPGGGSYGSAGSVHNFIESGQAFFVQTIVGSSGSISFTEAVKADTTSLLFTTPARAPQLQTSLRTSIYSVNGTPELLDGVLNEFSSNYSSSLDGWDARKSANTGENLSIKTAGRLLAVERRQPVTAQDTIFLNLTTVRAQPYRFSFDAANLNSGSLQGYLEDTYLHTSTPLNMNGNTVFDFSIVNIPGSYAADRFRIVFTQANVLPVTFTEVKAYRQDKHINVDWKVANELNIKDYTVEKSADGIHFTTMNTTAATGNGANTVSYQALDDHPVTGYNYYRIRSNDQDGKTSLTQVVKVLMGTIKQDINIYPNPITDGMIHLQFMNEPAGKYLLRLMNKAGQVILTRAVTRMDGNSTELIKWDYNLAHGMYQLEVTKPDGSVKNISVLY